MRRQYLLRGCNIQGLGPDCLCRQNEVMQPENIVNQFALALQNKSSSNERWTVETVSIRLISPETEGFPSHLCDYRLKPGGAPSAGAFVPGKSPEKVTLSSTVRPGAVTLWRTPPTTSTATKMQSLTFRPFAEEVDQGTRRRGFIGNQSTRL